ncbi:MAG: TRAP transporter large permease [Oscillospiraceae bacterium]|jgi:tripartite ATP-independent transporter DctM subunit|nr:TRAP transporter large permease [Oscillospiraceae bacterium]
MSNFVLGLIGLAVLVVLLFMGKRVGLAMAVVGFAGVWYLRGFNAALGQLMSTPFATLGNESLSVIPLFTLMGVVCAYAGISQDLYAACYKLVSRLRGGLAIATEIACAFFAAICGSSTATTASMGKICLPEMDKFNYKRTLTCGSISAGGTLGILIPPSVGFMLYGINAGVGVGKMFIAGIVPGILLCACYSSVVLVICALDPKAGPKGPKFTTAEKLKAGLGVLPVLILFALVLGGILLGWCSASEGAAVGAAGAFIFMIIRRKFTFKNVVGALTETAETTAMIFLIMIGANVLGNFLNMTGLPQAVANFAASANVAPIFILLACLLIYAILGCFVDSLPLIVLLTPIFLPIVRNLEFSFGGFGANYKDGITVWFGVLMVMLMQLGLMTPPVGMCCYVMSGVAKDTPLTTIFKGTAPFLVGIVVAIVIVLFLPMLSTWLPGLMVGG